MEKNKISIIMSTFNETESELREAIDSIVKQTYINFEFIIVLDNPNNEKIQEILEEYEKNDFRIKVIYNIKNIGLSKSLNKALSYCNGEFIARMDADDISYHNRLEKELQFLLNNNLDFVCTLVREISYEGKEVNIQKFKPINYEGIKKCLFVDNIVNHPTWLVRQNVYRDLDGYRNIHLCEDYDFILRSILKGYNIGICNEVLLDYRLRNDGISRSNLLKQKLSADFLAANINKLNSISQYEINEYLKGKKINEQKELKYNNARNRFSIGINKIKNRNFFGLKDILLSLILSKYIIIDFRDIFIVKL